MRLLIVEDDRKLAEFVARGLRAEHFAVDIAGDGLEGQRHLDAYQYDLLIVDLMLPKLGGGELLRRLRRIRSTSFSRTPIIGSPSIYTCPASG